MSLVATLPDPKVGIENSLPFSRTDPGVMRSRRNCCVRLCLLGADRSPEIFCPDASLPENVNTGMVLASPERSSLSPENFASTFGLPGFADFFAYVVPRLQFLYRFAG